MFRVVGVIDRWYILHETLSPLVLATFSSVNVGICINSLLLSSTVSRNNEFVYTGGVRSFAIIVESVIKLSNRLRRRAVGVNVGTYEGF